MKRIVKKRLKWAALIVVALLAFFLISVVVVTRWVLTPERLTPIVLKFANESLDARLQIERVELTFFSTFPKFGLRLTDGSLVSRLSGDSVPLRQDSLLSFSECVVTANPVAYLSHNRISLHELKLTDASVYAFKAADGRVNWDIVKASADTADTASADTTGFDGDIDLQRVVLLNTSLVFDDRSTDVYASVQGANLRLKASITGDVSFLKLKFDNRNLLFWQRGELLANKIALSLQTDIEVDRCIRTCRLKNADLEVNGVRFGAQGVFVGDTARKVVDIDFSYGLKVPSVETVLAMIPESIVRKSAVSAQGEVKMTGEVKGSYGVDQLPAATICIQIADASAHYKGLPYGIDRLSADFDAYIDLSRQKPSYADLKIFHFEGAHTDISATAKIEDLLSDPKITFHTKTKADLTSLAQAFPLRDSIHIAGKLDADLNLKCRLSSLKKQDIGRMALQGNLRMRGLEIVDSIHGFDFTGDAELSFTGEKTLQAKAQIDSLVVKSPLFFSTVSRLSADIRTSNPQDTTRIVDLECCLGLGQMRVDLPADSLSLFVDSTEATIRITPGKKNPAMPLVGLKLHTDSVKLNAMGNDLWLEKAGFDFEFQKIRDSLWIPRGTVGFDKCCVNAVAFKLPVCLSNTQVSVSGRDMILNNAAVQVGSSDLRATGSVHNLLRALTKGKLVKARLDIVSDRIDCAEIIGALQLPDAPDTEADTLATDMKLYVIPANIDFSLNTKIGRVTMNQMVFDDVSGRIDVKDQYLHLENLSMRALDADMKTVMVYKAADAGNGYVGVDFRIKQINVAKLVDFMPALDTIVPMLRSFKGRVDFEVAAETTLDSLLNVRLKDLRAAVHIKGDSLVLMDGETFAEISKMLMFKNKKENVFDSISVNLTIQDGNVIVYPFLVEIDRYRAAVGGQQGLDMQFNYHISILKSPLPFKAGVNIKGNLDKMKFGIGKAKYKDAVSPANIHKVDSTRLNLGQDIVNDFRQLLKPD